MMWQKNILSKINNWIVYVLFTTVICGIVGATYVLVDYLRKEEISRIELFAMAMKYQQDLEVTDPVSLELILQISRSNTSIPVIITDQERQPIGEDFMRNISKEIKSDSLRLQQMLNQMASTYPPFELKLPSGNQYVYYTNSLLLENLKYSPAVLGAIVVIYIVFSFWFLKTLKKTDEGFLWAGLAKETAHQIGTPLSSMIGWVEILKLENQNSEAVVEIEKDIQRLKTISERFSKIGSIPELNDLNLAETLQINYDYLKTRVSKKVRFKLILPFAEILIPHNRILISWVIENLVKNAVDAMKGEGDLSIAVYQKNRNVYIDIKDSGSGMSKSQVRKAFKPGFSTKKRGWGLGLSLAKRVIAEYHNGDIKIAHTEIGKGATFRIILKPKNPM